MQLFGGTDDDGADAPKQEGKMDRASETVESNDGNADQTALTGDYQLGSADTPLKAIGDTNNRPCLNFLLATDAPQLHAPGLPRL